MDIERFRKELLEEKLLGQAAKANILTDSIKERIRCIVWEDEGDTKKPEGLGMRFIR